MQKLKNLLKLITEVVNEARQGIRFSKSKGIGR